MHRQEYSTFYKFIYLNIISNLFQLIKRQKLSGSCVGLFDAAFGENGEKSFTFYKSDMNICD